MSTIIEFAIIGLGTGALYVLVSLGMVIIYRGSGVVNYAQGAMGMVGTYVFWDLWVVCHFPYALAAVIGILTSAILGVLTHILVMHPLRNAAPITRMIATLGILTVLEYGASFRWPTSALYVPSELPTSTIKFLGTVVGVDYLYIFGIVILVALALTFVYRRTWFGRVTMATSENPRALAALGVSPDRIAAVNWAIGGALAGGAGILLAPITGLDVTQLTLLVLPALAGAVVGRFKSFPLTVLGGLLIGVVSGEMTRYITTPGWASSAPFLVIIVVLVLRGKEQGIRSQLGERLSKAGSGRVRWTTLVPLLAVGIVLIQFMSPNWTDAVTTTVTMGIVLLSLVVVTGYSGQLSLAQFAFAGIGAYVAGRLVATTGMPFLAALAIGLVATLPVGFLLGLMCLRTRGTDLSIATLAFAAALEQILFDSYSLTGGVNGTAVGNPRVFGIDVDGINHSNRYAIMCLVFFVIAGLAVANIRRGKSGRRMLAVRGNERAAASLGVGVAGVRIYAFCVAAVIAALGGILMSFNEPFITYTSFTALTSVQIVSQAVVGGIGWIVGALLGGILTIGSVATVLLNMLGSTVALYLPLIGGVLLVLTVIASPDGIAYQNVHQYRLLRARLRINQARQKAREARSEKLPAGLDAEVRTPDRVKPATLNVEGLGVRFGGVVALESVTLSIASGEVVGLIGPNGAGKTTLIDAVTGFVSPTGNVTLNGQDISGWTPAKLARIGVARSFQSLELFDDMTVLDNFRVASEPWDKSSYLMDVVWPRNPDLSPEAVTAIRVLGLEKDLLKRPTELPFGRRRLVGIGRAVSMGPSILMLDEPAAGLDDHETAELITLIRKLANDWGMGILLIEHDVEMVMSTCDRVYALDFGRQIANGTPQEIRQNREVISAYLGEPVSELS